MKSSRLMMALLSLLCLATSVVGLVVPSDLGTSTTALSGCDGTISDCGLVGVVARDTPACYNPNFPCDYDLDGFGTSGSGLMFVPTNCPFCKYNDDTYDMQCFFIQARIVESPPGCIGLDGEPEKRDVMTSSVNPLTFGKKRGPYMMQSPPVRARQDSGFSSSASAGFRVAPSSPIVASTTTLNATATSGKSSSATITTAPVTSEAYGWAYASLTEYTEVLSDGSVSTYVPIPGLYGPPSRTVRNGSTSEILVFVEPSDASTLSWVWTSFWSGLALGDDIAKRTEVELATEAEQPAATTTEDHSGWETITPASPDFTYVWTSVPAELETTSGVVITTPIQGVPTASPSLWVGTLVEEFPGQNTVTVTVIVPGVCTADNTIGIMSQLPPVTPSNTIGIASQLPVTSTPGNTIGIESPLPTLTPSNTIGIASQLPITSTPSNTIGIESALPTDTAEIAKRDCSTDSVTTPLPYIYTGKGTFTNQVPMFVVSTTSVDSRSLAATSSSTSSSPSDSSSSPVSSGSAVSSNSWVPSSSSTPSTSSGPDVGFIPSSSSDVVPSSTPMSSSLASPIATETQPAPSPEMPPSSTAISSSDVPSIAPETSSAPPIVIMTTTQAFVSTKVTTVPQLSSSVSPEPSSSSSVSESAATSAINPVVSDTAAPVSPSSSSIASSNTPSPVITTVTSESSSSSSYSTESGGYTYISFLPPPLVPSLSVDPNMVKNRPQGPTTQNSTMTMASSASLAARSMDAANSTMVIDGQTVVGIDTGIPSSTEAAPPVEAQTTSSSASDSILTSVLTSASSTAAAAATTSVYVTESSAANYSLSSGFALFVALAGVYVVFI